MGKGCELHHRDFCKCSI